MKKYKDFWDNPLNDDSIDFKVFDRNNNLIMTGRSYLSFDDIHWNLKDYNLTLRKYVKELKSYIFMNLEAVSHDRTV